MKTDVKSNVTAYGVSNECVKTWKEIRANPQKFHAFVLHECDMTKEITGEKTG